MAEEWQKFILKQDRIKRVQLLATVDALILGKYELLDIHPIEGSPGYFRCRVGRIRIVFEKMGTHIRIDTIDYRGGVYKNF